MSPDTDLLQAQSIQYRRLSANLYETKNAGEYFHIHGSLEASTMLRMIGLEPHRPDLTDYRECINTIESHVKQFTAAELEIMNARERQAGVTALKWEDFKRSNHVCAFPLSHNLTEHKLIFWSGPNSFSTAALEDYQAPRFVSSSPIFYTPSPTHTNFETANPLWHTGARTLPYYCWPGNWPYTRRIRSTSH
jgi:hypothetical protein